MASSPIELWGAASPWHVIALAQIDAKTHRLCRTLAPRLSETDRLLARSELHSERLRAGSTDSRDVASLCRRHDRGEQDRIVYNVDGRFVSLAQHWAWFSGQTTSTRPAAPRIERARIAFTLAKALYACVERLHAKGLHHGGLHPEHIWFRPDSFVGRPTIRLVGTSDQVLLANSGMEPTALRSGEPDAHHLEVHPGRWVDARVRQFERSDLFRWVQVAFRLANAVTSAEETDTKWGRMLDTLAQTLRPLMDDRAWVGSESKEAGMGGMPSAVPTAADFAAIFRKIEKTPGTIPVVFVAPPPPRRPQVKAMRAWPAPKLERRPPIDAYEPTQLEPLMPELSAARSSGRGSGAPTIGHAEFSALPSSSEVGRAPMIMETPVGTSVVSLAPAPVSVVASGASSEAPPAPASAPRGPSLPFRPQASAMSSEVTPDGPPSQPLEAVRAESDQQMLVATISEIHSQLDENARNPLRVARSNDEVDIVNREAGTECIGELFGLHREAITVTWDTRAVPVVVRLSVSRSEACRFTGRNRRASDLVLHVQGEEAFVVPVELDLAAVWSGHLHVRVTPHRTRLKAVAR